MLTDPERRPDQFVTVASPGVEALELPFAIYTGGSESAVVQCQWQLAFGKVGDSASVTVGSVS